MNRNPQWNILPPDLWILTRTFFNFYLTFKNETFSFFEQITLAAKLSGTSVTLLLDGILSQVGRPPNSRPASVRFMLMASRHLRSVFAVLSRETFLLPVLAVNKLRSGFALVTISTFTDREVPRYNVQISSLAFKHSHWCFVRSQWRSY